jgi:hypothetical protein
MKSDLIINKDFNHGMGFSNYFGENQTKSKYDEYKITLISHIYFSVLIDKEKEKENSSINSKLKQIKIFKKNENENKNKNENDNDNENLKLNLEIIDELDCVKSNYSYDINQIDFICEAVILKMNYNEYKESIKLAEIIENNNNLEINKDKDKDEDKDNDGNKSKLSSGSLDYLDSKKFEGTRSKEMIDYNQVSEILGNMNYLKNMVETNKMKIINVDGIVKNIDII